MPQPNRGAFRTGGTLATAFLLGVSANAAPPTVSLAHPLPKAPAPEANTSVRRGFPRGFERELQPLPFSRALVTSDGSALYSRSVNRILCAASDERGRKTWLGTALGIKCVDQTGGVVRHYGVRDGLPAGRVAAIAASPEGDVWCVIQGRPGPAPAPVIGVTPPVPAPAFSFCAFDPAGGTWKTLKTITPLPARVLENNPFNSEAIRYRNEANQGYTGRPLIAVGDSEVLFTTGISGGADRAAAYRWNRRGKTLQPLLWEAGQRADNPFLMATFVAVDREDSSLWIGSNAGLLHHRQDMPGGESGRQRLFPDQSIQAGATALGGGVWVVAVPRRIGDRLDTSSPTAAPAAWKLHRIVGVKPAGRREIPLPAPPVAPDPPGETPSEKDRRVSGPVPNTLPPVAVTVDAKGALWLTQKTSDLSRGYGRGSLAAWWRRAPVTGAWTRFEMQVPGERAIGPQQPPPDPPPLRRTRPSGEITDFVSLGELADAAVFPLATSPLPPIVSASPERDAAEGTSPDDPQANLWVRRRFPRWVCSDDLPAGITQTSLTDLGRIRGRTRVPAQFSGTEALPDPTDPSGRVWIADTFATSLLNLPAAEVPTEARQGGGVRPIGPGRFSRLPDGPNVKRYTLPAGRTVLVRPAVLSATALGPKGRYLFLVGEGGLLARLDTADGVVSPVVLPSERRFSSGIEPIFTTEGALLLSQYNGQKTEITRFDPMTGASRAEATIRVPGRLSGVTPGGGLLVTGNDGKVWFQEPGTAEPFVLPVEIRGADQTGGFGGGGRSGTGFVAVGAVVWGFDTEGELFGYDVERRRRTPGIDLRAAPGNGYPNRKLSLVSDGQGGAYTAGESAAGAVFHYDRGRNGWEVAAPPLPTRPVTAMPGSLIGGNGPSSQRPSLTLVSASETEIWLLSDSTNLVRYDRRKKMWEDPVPLPPALRSNGFGTGISVTEAENGEAFYAGGRAGLWRWDRKTARWEAKQISVPVEVPEAEFGIPSLSARIIAVVPGKDAVVTVWNQNNAGNFAARLDKRTGAWTIDDETKGFPGRGVIFRLTATGSGAWLVHSTGTYFFDAARGLWRVVFGPFDDRSPDPAARAPLVALPRPEDKTLADAENGTVADIDIDPKNGDSLLLVNFFSNGARKPPALFRFDKNGVCTARSPAPSSAAPAPNVFAGSLLADSDSVLVATNVGILRTAGKDGEIWAEVTPPAGFAAPAAPTDLQHGPNGRGLYVISGDSIAYWSDRGSSKQSK